MFIINIIFMLKDVINILKDISLRHKGVRTFRYQGDIYNNAQNNYKTYQVYCDDVSFHHNEYIQGRISVVYIGFPRE